MTEATTLDQAARPQNVPADRVVDIDIYRAPPPGVGFQEAWLALRHAHPVSMVWTPHNGGHWVALRGAVIDEVLSDSERFSSHTVLVPKDTAGEAYRLIPLSLDPPEHQPFRNLLNENLSLRALEGTEESIRDLTIELIEGFRAKGRCDFIREFAEKLPVRVFMQIVDLPLADLPKLKHLADQFTRPDGSLTYEQVGQMFRAYIQPILQERRGSGRRDMVSRMISGEINGRPLSDLEAANICIQVLVGGLDTVINFMGFVMLHLARHGALRQALVTDPKRIPEAINEFLRRFPLVASAREVRRDTLYEGVELRAGDMVLAPTILSGLDEAINPEPLRFDLDRPGRRHTTFGKGSHTCPGSALARLELRILVEEWLSRIPEFRLESPETVTQGAGVVGTVHPYVLAWD